MVESNREDVKPSEQRGGTTRMRLKPVRRVRGLVRIRESCRPSWADRTRQRSSWVKTRVG